VLLHMMAGSKEDAETATAFFEDMKRRGLNDPPMPVQSFKHLTRVDALAIGHI
jgi:hypothetical protein